MEIGNCRLCGTLTELTFEHVPPRVAFNKRTRYINSPAINHLTSQDILNAKPKGPIKQGGVGYHALCISCNNFLGGTYVKPFSWYINSFVEFANKKEFNRFDFIMHDFEAGKVLKQIVSMF